MALTATAQEWFIRSEQQVLYRLTQRHVLFTIRVVFAGLIELIEHPVEAGHLKQVLQRMNNYEIEQFGGVDKYTQLLDYV